MWSGRRLYFDAPFINFCHDHHKEVIVVVKGDQRLLLQDAQQLFSSGRPASGPRVTARSGSG